jgi:hypothetical protein
VIAVRDPESTDAGALVIGGADLDAAIEEIQQR